MEEKINGILNIFFYKKIKDMNEKMDRLEKKERRFKNGIIYGVFVV